MFIFVQNARRKKDDSFSFGSFCGGTLNSMRFFFHYGSEASECGKLYNEEREFGRRIRMHCAMEVGMGIERMQAHTYSACAKYLRPTHWHWMRSIHVSFSFLPIRIPWATCAANVQSTECSQAKASAASRNEISRRNRNYVRRGVGMWKRALNANAIITNLLNFTRNTASAWFRDSCRPSTLRRKVYLLRSRIDI